MSQVKAIVNIHDARLGDWQVWPSQVFFYGNNQRPRQT